MRRPLAFAAHCAGLPVLLVATLVEGVPEFLIEGPTTLGSGVLPSRRRIGNA